MERKTKKRILFYRKMRIILLAYMILLVQIVSPLMVSASDTAQSVSTAVLSTEIVQKFADFTFTTPSSETGATYTVDIYIQRSCNGVYANLSGTEIYDITGADSISMTRITFTQDWIEIAGNGASTMCGSLVGLAPNTTVTIADILMQDGESWDSTVCAYDQAEITLYVTSSNEGEVVTVNPSTSIVTGDYTLSADAMTVQTGVDTTVYTYGDFTFTLPTQATDEDGKPVSIEDGTEYNVTVYLTRTYNGSMVSPTSNGYEDYGFTVGENLRATRLTAGWVDLLGDGTDYGVYYGTLTGLSPGDEVTIQDILLSKLGADLEWAERMDTTYISLKVESTNASEVVVVSEELIKLSEGVTTLSSDNITSSYQEKDDSNIQQLTTDTLNSVGNEIIFLLSYYNVVSLKDIEATHIVGPIIAQERAYRTDNTYASSAEAAEEVAADYLYASDYSRGVSSYVGVLEAINSSPYDATFKLNYGFEMTTVSASGAEIATDFTPPNFYTRATELEDSSILVGVSQENISNELRDVVYLYKDNPVSSFFSPNMEGRVENYDTSGALQSEQTLTLQNDNYIDFDNYWANIISASQFLLENGSFTEDKSDDMIVIDATGKTSLTLEAGYSYLIQNANVLQTVDIDFPEDENGEEIYDFFENPYPEETIINFDGNTINPTTIDGKLVSQFPETLVNGEVLEALSGDGGEYSEVGNKIVWNLANVVTTESGSNRLVFSTVGPNVAGHIVAPYAELWNYYQSESGTVTWGGGNLNGTAIVADFHGGYMEMHMWAYSGLEEIGTAVNLSVIKIYENGNLDNQSFDFILDQVAGKDYTGMVDTVMLPYTGTSNSSGNVYFPSLIFEVDSAVTYPKTYEFTIKEVIPDEQRTDINYDETEYLIAVTVSEKTTVVGEMTYVNLSSSYVITKSEETGEVEEIVFTNVKTTGDASYSFTKISDTGYSLNGAEFMLSEDIDDWSDAVLYVSGTEAAADGGTEAAASGTVTFSDLELERTYYLKETSAPSGYNPSDGYWKITVNEVGDVFVEAMDGAPEIVNHQIVNYPSTPEVIDITLTKETDTGKMLQGAVFIIEQVLSLDQPTTVEGGYHGTFTSGEDGSILISNLLYDGVYRITEIAAPDGYMIPENISYWLLDVHCDGSVVIYDPDLYEVDSDGQKSLVDGLGMINISGYILPATGGMGTVIYPMLGMLLMIAAGFYSYRIYGKRRKVG